MSIQFSQAFLDLLRSRISLSGILSRKTKLVRAGKLFKGCCPFHNEKTPSFVVYEDQGTYHCFGCGAHGDAISFLTTVEGYSFPEAVAHLAEQAGIPLPREERQEQRISESLPLRECLEAAAGWFEGQLHSAQGDHARRYLAKRKLSAEVIRQFRIGYAPAGNRLKDYLSKAGFSTATQIDAGLLVNHEERQDNYDRFRDRLMFPICDKQGRIIGFGGRILGAGEPKYLNSPETALFHKGHELYGFHFARKNDFKVSPLIVCEGYTDVLALHQAGYKGAVAPLGTALTEAQIELLWRMEAEPLLCFDGDSAGQKAAWRAAERSLSILRPGFSLNFISLPAGDDPASLLEKEQANSLATIFEKKQTLADLLWSKEIAGQAFNTPEQKAALQKRMLDYAAQIKDVTLQSFYKGYFKNKIFDYFRTQPQKRAGATTWSRPRIDVMERQQKILLLAVIHHPAILSEVFEAFAAVDIKTSALADLRDMISEQFNLHHALDSATLQHHLCAIGYEELIKTIQADVQLHASFAAPGADLKDVLNGWWAIWNLCQQRQLQADESKYLTATFAEDMSAEFWQKIQKMKEISLAEKTQEIFES